MEAPIRQTVVETSELERQNGEPPVKNIPNIKAEFFQHEEAVSRLEKLARLEPLEPKPER